MKNDHLVTLALVAGTALSASAQTTPKAGPQAPARQPTAALATAGISIPTLIRSVKMVEGRLVPTSEWRAYTPRTGTADNPPEYVFDSLQDAPGVPPGTNPTTGRYLLQWTTGLNDYYGSYRAHDMASIPAGAQGHGATTCDIMYYVAAAAPLYVTVFTAETWVTNLPPSDPAWGVFPGIQLTYANQLAGFWFSPIDVSLEPPPVGDGWMMPADGSGAYLVKMTLDAAGTLPVLQGQTGMWGTGDSMRPPVAKVGTQGFNEMTDDETPPTCGWPGLPNDIPNGLLELTTGCELRAFNIFGNPAPSPLNLATAIGFGMKLAGATGACCTSTGCQVLASAACAAAGGTYGGDNTTCSGPGEPSTCCYANCDGSTQTPCLNVLDFGCFLNAFAANSSYANCDASTQPPVLNVLDFGCFLNRFAGGCSNC